MATCGQIVKKFADELKKVARMQASERLGAAAVVGTSKTEEFDSMKILSEAGNMLNPSNKLVTMIEKLNSSPVTNASPSLRSSAKDSLENIRKLRVNFSDIEESLRKISRIRDIIEKEDRNQDEKRELIEYATENSPEPVVEQWLNENTDVFSRLVDLVNFIRLKLDEEVDRKKKEEEELEREFEKLFGKEPKKEPEKEEVKEDDKEQDRKWKKIELIFLAHGLIVNRMIPASSLLPSPSITDVLLYSPWNCALTVEAGYSIAMGTIQLEHRVFCPATHKPLNLPHRWNSMRNTERRPVPVIMVSPVVEGTHTQFATFTTLKADNGEPPDNRYLITFDDAEIGRVPFFAFMKAISLVLPHYGYEATVHLAACLTKSPEDAVMPEEYLSQQYAYTVDNTTMTVPGRTIRYIDEIVFNMFKAVFGD